MPSTSSKSAHPSDAPDADVIEVSIFGPGKGEAILVHLGHGDWIVVDSCRNQGNRRHPVLDYLDKIGVDVSKQVRLVVGTHAHDDHLDGISEVFERAASAKFVTSSATLAREFFALMAADASIEAQVDSRVRREYRSVFDEVDRRAGTPGDWIRRGDENRTLWERASNGEVVAAKVVSLSPSETAVWRAQQIMAEALSKFENHPKLSSADPNEMAVALWVQAGHQSLLLGADLLIGPEGCGWKAVVGSFEQDGRASLFKIPHHGSENAHYEPVWDEMIGESRTAIMAPYRAGRTAIPKPDDVTRILSYTGDAYISATPNKPVPSHVRRTKAALQGVAIDVRDPWGVPGQVRARSAPGQPVWHVEVFWPARHLSDL